MRKLTYLGKAGNTLNPIVFTVWTGMVIGEAWEGSLSNISVTILVANSRWSPLVPVFFEDNKAAASRSLYFCLSQQAFIHETSKCHIHQISLRGLRNIIYSIKYT